MAMSLEEQGHRIEESIQTEVPEVREYTDQTAADLDESLCDAIKAAEAHGNEYLAQVLRHELGSHYYKTR